MKKLILKFVSLATIVALMYACGSSHNVIHDGKVYEVKGDQFFQAGVEVTESISEETKTRIQEKLDTRLDLRAEEERQQEELEKKT